MNLKQKTYLKFKEWISEVKSFEIFLLKLLTKRFLTNPFYYIFDISRWLISSDFNQSRITKIEQNALKILSKLDCFYLNSYSFVGIGEKSSGVSIRVFFSVDSSSKIFRVSLKRNKLVLNEFFFKQILFKMNFS